MRVTHSVRCTATSLVSESVSVLHMFFVFLEPLVFVLAKRLFYSSDRVVFFLFCVGFITTREMY